MNINIIRNHLTFAVFTFASFNGLAAPVAIDTSTMSHETSDKLSFGIGVTRSKADRPFRGVDSQSASLPYISLSYKQFYIEGLNVGFRLYNKENLSVQAIASPRFWEVKSSFADEDELDGIEETKPTYFGGLLFQYKTDPAIFTLQALADIGGESDGIEVIASASKPYSFNKLVLSPSVSINWQSSDLVDHFYGVQSNEVIAKRPLFEGESTINYQASVSGIYQINDKWDILGAIKYDLLGDDILDSPIIEEDQLASYALGILYRFD